MQNPHPLLVHFPLAFLTGAALASIVALAIKRPWLATFARTCLYLGTLAAGMTVISGFLASQTVAAVVSAREGVLEHQTFGYVTLAIAALLSAWSIVAWRRLGREPRPTAVWALANVALLLFLVLTGKEGGELVHEHGLGTALTAPAGPLYEGRAIPPRTGLKFGADPAAGDSVPTARDFR